MVVVQIYTDDVNMCAEKVRHFICVPLQRPNRASAEPRRRGSHRGLSLKSRRLRQLLFHPLVHLLQICSINNVLEGDSGAGKHCRYFCGLRVIVE